MDPNKDIYTKLTALSSQEDLPRFSVTSSHVNFKSPREAAANSFSIMNILKNPLQPSSIIDNIMGDVVGAAEKVMKQGSLKEIYEKKRLKYMPSIELATPNVNETKVE